VRLEGLGQLKKCNDLIGNRTRDLPACSMVLAEMRQMPGVLACLYSIVLTEDVLQFPPVRWAGLGWSASVSSHRY
jgi:hypothetical protein